MTEWMILAPAVLVGLLVWRWLFAGIPADPHSFVRVEAFRAGDAVLACVLAGYFLLGIANASDEPRKVTVELILAGGLIYLVVAVFVIVFLQVRGVDVVQIFGLRKHRIWPDLGVAGIGLLSVYPIVALSSWIVREELGEAAPKDSTIEFLKQADAATLIPAGILIVLVAPLVEELIFRGLLYGVAKRYAGRMAAALTTSVLFAAIHQNPASWIPLFFLSLAFTFAYERTGSLWTPVWMHMLFNGSQFLVLMIFPEWLQ